MLELIELIKNALLIKVDDIGSAVSSTINQNIKAAYVKLSVLFFSITLLSVNSVILLSLGVYWLLSSSQSIENQELISSVLIVSGTLFTVGLIIFLKIYTLFKVTPEKNLTAAIDTLFNRIDVTIGTIKKIDEEKKFKAEYEDRMHKIESLLINMHEHEKESRQTTSED